MALSKPEPHLLVYAVRVGFHLLLFIYPVGVFLSSSPLVGQMCPYAPVLQ